MLHIGHQREELDIELEWNKLTQGDSFMYLGGAVCGDGNTEREVCRRAEAGVNACRAVEGGDGGSADLKKTKGQGHEHLCDTGMHVRNGNIGMTELQQQRLQVCANNWVRKIARVTSAGRRIMVELREETGVQMSLTEKLLRSRLQWTGHGERMADDRLSTRAA